MKNFSKIDPRLFEVISLQVDKKVDCIAYVSNFVAAKRYFGEQEIVSELPFINAIALNIDYKKMIDVCNRSWVKCITKQASVMALMNVARNVLGTEGVATGKGVTIAYIDTGIAPHLDFSLKQNRVLKFVDLINHREQMYDDNGHGTFVSGVGSGSGVVSNGKYRGIAPESNIISIKALNENGEASAIKILDAMQWVFDNASKYNIRVVCMSFGSEPLGINDPIMKGAEVLWDKGIVMVAAAGNSGPDFETIKSPGVSAKIITVGGLNDNRTADGEYNSNFFEIAQFSSRGPAYRRYKPDLVAPAVNITSCGIKKEQSYVSMSGTSVATPMIAGMCALILQGQENLSSDLVKYKLMSTCKGITFNRNLEGVGYPKFN